MARNAITGYSETGGTLSAEPRSITANADRFRGRLCGIAVAQRTISESIVCCVAGSILRGGTVASERAWGRPWGRRVPIWCGWFSVE